MLSGAGAAPGAAAGPLAAGVAAPHAPRRLYWVPAVGPVPSIHRYRQDAGLDDVPLPPMVDVGSAPLVGAGEALAPGHPHAEQMVAAAAAGVSTLALP